MFPQAITDHLNQLDTLKGDDDAARSQLSDLDSELAALQASRNQQAVAVQAKDSALSAAADDTITLIKTYYKPGGAIPSQTAPTPPDAPAVNS